MAVASLREIQLNGLAAAHAKKTDARHLLENVLAKARNSRSPLLRIVKDTFELCLAKCRTSSSSVQQENVYRDNTYKFCYGLDPPTLQVRR
eukprot:gene15423-6664_t